MKKVKLFNSYRFGLNILFLIVVYSFCSCSEQTKDCIGDYSDCLEGCDDELCKLNCGDSFKECTGTKYIFPIHFCVVTDNYSESNEVILAQLKKEVSILNTYFSAEDSSLPDNRRKIVTFKFKSASFYYQIEDIESDFIDEITQAEEYNGTDVQNKFNAETNILIRDPNAINIYIYDSWSTSSSWANNDGHGRNNSNKPYVLIDYTRLNHNIMAPEEHEMGHAFGLAHVCSETSNNIMGSSGNYPSNNSYSSADADTYIDCSYGGGTREVGFNSSQCRIILQNAEDIDRVLGL